MSDTNFKARRRLGAGCFVLFTFALGMFRPAGAWDVSGNGNSEVNPSQEQIASVRDSFDWAGGIISALESLAPVLVPSSDEKKLSEEREYAKREKRYRDFLRNHAWVRQAFVGRHLFFRKNTVFGLFDLTVNETAPGAFSMIVGSAAPAENIQIKDGASKAILLDQPLDDETVFAVRVPHALDARLSVSVSVLRDGGIEKVYFPLFNGDPKH